MSRSGIQHPSLSRAPRPRDCLTSATECTWCHGPQGQLSSFPSSQGPGCLGTCQTPPKCVRSHLSSSHPRPKGVWLVRVSSLSPCHNRYLRFRFQNFWCLGYALDYNWQRLADTPCPRPVLCGWAAAQRWLGGLSHRHPPDTPRQLAPATLLKLAAEGGQAKCKYYHCHEALPTQSQHPPWDHWFEDRKGCIYLQATFAIMEQSYRKREHTCMVILDNRTLLYPVRHLH